MRIFANRSMILIHARRDTIHEKVIVDFVNRHFKYKVQGESGIFIHHCAEETNSKTGFFIGSIGTISKCTEKSHPN